MKTSEPDARSEGRADSEPSPPPTKVKRAETRVLGQAACTFSAEADALHPINLLSASSGDKVRHARVNPSRIEKSVESAKRNRRLRRKGLG